MKQHYFIRSESGDFYKKKRDCGISYTEPEENNPLNWAIDFNQQARDEKSGNMIQFVCEITKNPIQIFPDRPVKEYKVANDIFFQTFEDALSERNYESKKSGLLLWFAIFALIFAIVISIVVLTNMNKGETISTTLFIMPLFYKLSHLRNGHHVLTDAEIEGMKSENSDEPVLCGIINQHSRTFKEYQYINRKHIPKDSIPGNYLGQPYHLLSFNGEFKPVVFPDKVEIGQSPQSLTNILKRVPPLVNKVFANTSNLLTKIKIGILVGFCFVEVIILFLIFGSLG